MNEAHLNTYAWSEIADLKIHGRTKAAASEPLPLFWTGSGIELNASGTELWVELEAGYNSYEPWISVLVNDAAVSRQMVTRGKRWIPIYRGMNPDEVKNVRILKEVQAMSGDPACSLRVHALSSDGSFYPVKERRRKLEFIGDSITSGEGAVGARQEADWIPMWFSALHNYTALTAGELDADYRVLSQSGWGVMTGWDNNPHANLPRCYDQVCGVLTGESNEALGALERHDFESWQPDAIIVNLGTNDAGAFYSPQWQDESTGERHKQRLNEDGSFNEEDLKRFEEAAERFLRKLREHNPESIIVWAYGMLGIPMMPAIYRAVDAYVRSSGDRKASVFQLPDMTPETVGARSHPGAAAHERAARALSACLRGKLGWE